METVNIGIDLGGTNAQGAAAHGGKIVRRGKVPTRSALGPDTVLADLADLALDLAQGQPIAALGIGLPGLLDLERGVCLAAENLGWQDVPIVAPLKARLQAPVFMENDARVAALGEYSQGQAQGCRHFLYLTVGTGIGGGIFSDGRLLQGAHWAAGEVGHMVMDPHGPACACGNNGCLEALASATAIAREGRKAALACPSSLLNTMADNIDAASVFRAAGAGDKAAQEVITAATTWLGIGIANLINVFNPELVVIGGGVSLAGDQLLKPIRAMVERYAMRVQRETVSITTSSLGDAAGVAGALELINQHLKKHP